MQETIFKIVELFKAGGENVTINPQEDGSTILHATDSIIILLKDQIHLAFQNDVPPNIAAIIALKLKEIVEFPLFIFKTYDIENGLVVWTD